MDPVDAPLQSLALRAANHQPQADCTRAHAAPPALPCAERAPGRHRGVRLSTRARRSFAGHRNERPALRRRTPFQARLPTAVLVRAAHVSATESSKRLTIWGNEERRWAIWCHELVQLLSPSSAAAIRSRYYFLPCRPRPRHGRYPSSHHTTFLPVLPSSLRLLLCPLSFPFLILLFHSPACYSLPSFFHSPGGTIQS